MRARLIATAAIAIAVAGCFKASPPATESVGPATSTTVSSESIFPHKSNWSDPTQHGLYVKDALGFDASTCLGCHGETDTVNGGAPSCRSCHKNFPHTEPGITLETHGAYVVANGKGACATQCHGTDLKGGLSGKACTDCHSNYPHANAWSTPAIHGPAAKGDLKNNCMSCHGSDLKGGDSKVSCYTCHKETYPHPQGWSAPDQHGKFVQTNGTGKCATQCHGVQLDGGLSGVSCKTCHTVWPHPATNWMKQHSETARMIGISACLGCHKTNPPGGQTGISCAQCHASLPAHADADWAKSGHGKLAMQQPTSLTAPTGCPLCHGTKLEGGKIPTQPTLKQVPACTSCHATYPQLHKPAAGTAAWNTFDGHGKWVMAQVDISKGDTTSQINTLIADCKLCHGDDLQGGNTGKSCYVSGCHVSFPHPPAAPGYSPWASKHGVYANAETPKAKSCATANCHGVDLQGLPAGEKDVSKKLVKGCADCHLQMPHLPKEQWDHGKSIYMAGTTQLDVKNCAQCHGDTWKGKSDAPSCYTCHDTYPLPHRSDDGKINPAWKPATGHGDFVMSTFAAGSVKNTAAAPCKICHGSDLNGGASGKTCYKCHKSFPHAAAPVTANGVTYTFTDSAWDGLKGFANSHGQYIVARATLNKVTTAQQITSECAKACHGTDLKGGTSKKSCFTCHANYPHSTDWVKAYDPADTKTPGGAHGLFVLKNGTSTCLTGCHGSEGSGGNSKVACTSCHNYPHKADWKSGSNSPEYPPHALSVITTNNTANKNDDTFNAAGFADCAKCHGDTVDFVLTYQTYTGEPPDYPLPESSLLITREPGVTLKRCTSCHIYPHQKIKWRSKSGTWSEYTWYKNGHMYPALQWPIDSTISCGSADGKPGCHISGPVPAPQGFSISERCDLCHK